MSQSQQQLPLEPQMVSILVLAVLAVGFGGTMLVTEIHSLWIIAGTVTAIVVNIALDSPLLPPSVRRPARAVVLFVVGGLVLWVVFELQPAIGVYSSASFGAVIGLLTIRLGQWRRDSQLSG